MGVSRLGCRRQWRICIYIGTGAVRLLGSETERPTTCRRLDRYWTVRIAETRSAAGEAIPILSLFDPDAAAIELERAVTELPSRLA